MRPASDRHRRSWLVAFWCLAVPPVAGAQIAAPAPTRLLARGDVYLLTRDYWRGIRRNAHPVGQADAMVALVSRSLSLSGGGWTSAEPVSTRGEVRPDLRAGGAGPSQWSVWGQAGWRITGLVVAAGVLRDGYVRPGPDPGVTELYALARLQAGRWAPSVSAWQAVDGAHGLYLQPAIEFDHFVNPFGGPAVSWSTTLTSGFQLGRRRPSAGAAVPGPEGTGLTHVELRSSVRAALNLTGALALVVATGPALQLSRDPAARRRRDGTQGSRLGFRWPVQAGLSFPLARPQ